MNEFFGEGLVDLGPQSAHRHIDHIGVTVKVHVPHVLRDQGAQYDLAGMAGQIVQENKLLGGEVHALRAPLDAPASGIDFQLAHAQQALWCGQGCAAARDHLDACQQFGKRKGLDHVVVGTQQQPLDAVFDLVAARDEKHRCLLLCANALQHVPAAGAGQPHIEQDEVVVPRGGQVQAFHPVECRVYNMAMLGQALLQVGGG